MCGFRTQLYGHMVPPLMNPFRREGSRRCRFLASALFAAICGFCSHIAWGQEASELIKDLVSEDHIVRERASRELVQRGAENVPHLAEALKSADADLRDQAARVLSRIGPEARPAEQALVVALNDSVSEVSVSAAHALWYIGPTEDVIPALVEALHHRDPKVRGFVARALGKTGVAAREAVPTVIGMLAEQDAFIRTMAVWALPEMHPQPEQLVRELFARLKDNEAYDNEETMMVCQIVGGNSVGFLDESLNDGVPRVRRMAAEVLRGTGERARPALPSLTRMLDDSDPTLRWAAASALCGIGPDSDDAFQPLLRALRSEDARTRRVAVCALGKMGARASAALPELMEAVKDQDPGVRTQAAGTFWMIKPDIYQAIPALIDTLLDPDGNVGSQAAWSLENIGAVTVPYLIEAMQAEGSKHRAAAAKVLGDFGPEAAPAIPALMDVLLDRRTYVSREAVDALCKIGGTEVVAAVEGLLQSDDNQTRIMALRVLGKMGPEAKSAAPTVATVLVDSLQTVRESMVSQAAIEALGSMGEKPIAVLTAALNDSQPHVRAYAALLLGTLGPIAREAIPALNRLLTDEDDNVRKSAASAIKKIDPS